MLTLTVGDRVLERVFCAYVKPEQMESFINELRKEAEERGEVFVEIWREVSHTSIKKRRAPTKKEEAEALVEAGGYTYPS